MSPRTKTGSRTQLALLALLALALTLAPSVSAAADVEFYASADREEVALDDTLTLTVTVGLDAGNGEDANDLKLPDTPDFEVLSRSQSQQMSFAMGHGGPPTFRKVRVFTLLLQPRRTGSFTIKAGHLTYRGKAYQTGDIRVKVLAAGGGGHRRNQPGPGPSPTPPAQPPAQPPNPFAGLGGLLGDDPDAQEMLEQFFGGGAARPTSDSDLYLRTFIDKRQAYLGEQITFSTFLFSRVDITGVDSFKMPKFDGFWAEDLETPQQITGDTKMIDGVPYRVFLLRKRALFAIKSGKLTIDPVEVDVSTGFGMVLSGRKVHRTSPPIAVDVLPLPQGAPAGFETPNVGQWRLSAEAAPTTVTLGQPITLKVALEGSGNLHDVVAPKLPAIPGLKVYDPTITEKTTTGNGRFGGKRLLEYLMMPEQTGSFEVPALTLHYFNPATHSYLQATTQPITLHVDAGAGGTQASNPSVAAVNSDHAVNVLDQAGLRPIRYKGELVHPAPALYARPFFLPAALSPFALWLLLWAAGLLRATLQPSIDGVQRGMAGKARRRLRGARALLKAKRADAFYAEVSRAFNDYLTARLHGPVAGLTRPDLSARLTLAGLKPELVPALCALLDTCDVGRFAPGGSTPSTMQRVLEDASGVMAALDGARLSAPSREARP